MKMIYSGRLGERLKQSFFDDSLFILLSRGHSST
jgi:hypothetical protein